MTAAFLHLTSSVARIYNGTIFAMNKHALLTALPRTCPREQPLGSVLPSCAMRCDAHVDVDFMAVLLLRSGRRHSSTYYTTEVTRKLIKSWISGKVLNVSVMLLANLVARNHISAVICGCLRLLSAAPDALTHLIRSGGRLRGPWLIVRSDE